MKHACLVCLLLCLSITFLLAQSNPVPPTNQGTGVVPPISAGQPEPKAQVRILENYGKLPLSFEANHGQTDPRVKFLSRTGGYTLFLSGDEAVLALSEKKTDTKAKTAGRVHTLESPVATKAGGVLRMKLRNANRAVKVSGTEELAGTSSYFIGNDPTKWHTSVPTYAKVKYEQIYSGIDLIYYGNQRQLEYDFIVAPGADPHRIGFEVRGARIRQDAQGDLILKMNDREIRWHKPVVYQEKEGTRREITARYAITDANRVGFELAKYDASRALYIDPLIYSTYLGGSLRDVGVGIALDGAGDAYVTGSTCSTDFPTMAPLQSDKGGCNAFVSKLNPPGTAVIYSTYLGGSGDDYGSAIAVDSKGNAYVAGLTGSFDFPTMKPLQPTCVGAGGHCADAFVTKINPSGSALVYSTYLGGSDNDYALGIAVSSSGKAYVTGTTFSSDFPTMNALQPIYGGNGDAFVVKLNSAGSALVYSTYLGGNQEENGASVVVDSSGNAYLTGYTQSTDFPTTPGAFQTNFGSASSDAFVTKLNSVGTALVYSTFLGGSGSNGGLGIAVDDIGSAFVVGGTESTDFPVTPGAFQTVCNDGSGCSTNGDAFVAKFNPKGSALVYSSYLGSGGQDFGSGIAVDSAGSAYVTGQTSSGDFPTTPGAFQSKCGGGHKCPYSDAFVAKLNPSGSTLVYSTYLGGRRADWGSGIAVDSADDAYVTGGTRSVAFPTTAGAFQTKCSGSDNECDVYGDAFVTAIQMPAWTTTTLTSSSNPSTYGQTVTFTAVVTSGIGPPPDGETISIMKGKTVLGSGTLSSGSASFSTSALPVGTYSITAVYAGDSNFANSTSKVVKQVVEKSSD